LLDRLVRHRLVLRECVESKRRIVHLNLGQPANGG
jgi:hypothetical protein